MSGFGSGKACVELVEALFVELYDFFLVDEVVEAGIAVGDDVEFKIVGFSHKCRTFEDCVESSAVSATGQDSNFFHGSISP